MNTIFVIIGGLLLVFLATLIRIKWWDSVFPLHPYQYFGVNEYNYLYLWHHEILWYVSFIDKLRGVSSFLLSSVNLYSINIFFGVFFLIWYLSFFFLIQKILNKKYIFVSVMLSILFVINPLTVAHIWHHFLLQWYLIYPGLLLGYIHFMEHKSYINIHTILIAIAFLLLGQPHNYYNAILILWVACIFYIIHRTYSYKVIFEKNITLFSLSLLFFSGLIACFFASIPNDLTSSVGAFSGTEPNMVWSTSQGLLNTLVFDRSAFPNIILLMIFLSANIIIIGLSIIYGKKNKYYLFFLIIFILIASLAFIAKNPLFSFFQFKEIVYKIIPHLRIDIAYIELIFIFLFLICIAGIYSYFSQNRLFRGIFTICILIEIIVSINIFWFQNKHEENIINSKEYNSFNIWLKTNISDESMGNILIEPFSVAYKVPGITKNIYPILFFEWVQNKYLLHWNFLELSLPLTRDFLNQHIIANTQYLLPKNTGIKYILCLNECDWDLKPNFHLVSSYWKNIQLYKYDNYNPIISWYNSSFQEINPTRYHIALENLKALSNISFLESFHPEWKLYLEPYSPLDCTPIATYTGTTIDSDPSKSLSKMGTGTLSTVALLQKQETEPFVLSAMKLKTLVATAFLAEIQKLFPAKMEAHTSKEPSYHTTECKPQNTFYAGGELSKLWEKPVFDDTHKLVYDYANSWTIDPEYIKANYPSSYYKQNPDGSIDIRMTLYFRPQSYFYLGLIISGTTFVLLLGYLGWSVVRRKNIAK